MAAYAYSATVDIPAAIPIGIKGVHILTGSIDITNYNSTNAEVTEITGSFGTLLTVIPAAVTDNGYAVSWTGTSFKAWYGDYNNASDGPLIQVPNDTDVGEFDFIAFGLKL